jgi:hypothetical protein
MGRLIHENVVRMAFIFMYVESALAFNPLKHGGYYMYHLH